MRELNALRKVANIETLKWEILEQPGLPNENVWWYNISYNETTGEGSYLYKMGPGAQSNPHEHEGPEEFYMLEGDLRKDWEIISIRIIDRVLFYLVEAAVWLVQSIDLR